MIGTDVIILIRGGDILAFRRLAEECTDQLFATAFRMTGNEEDSRDIVQDTLVTVWQKRAELKNPESVTSWIKKILVNKCYDLLRKKKKENSFITEPDLGRIEALIDNNTPETNLENAEQLSVIKALTLKLSPKQKTVFILSEIEGLSQEEINDLTGMVRTSIKSNLLHARRKIREMINTYLK